MKCSLLLHTKLILLIAFAVSLSNSFYAQNAVDRTTAVPTNDDKAIDRTIAVLTNDDEAVDRTTAALTNDDCSRATLLQTKLMSTFSTFSMVGAGRSINKYKSVCEEPNELQQAVWFKTFIPNSGKLNVYLQCENEMPRITIFYGECENLKYLACDGSSNVDSKMLTIYAKQLIEKPVFIRVATTNTLTKDFDIKVENPSIPPVAIKDFSVINGKKGNRCQWTIKSEIESFRTELLYSTDGMKFKSISSEKGQNHSKYKQHYFIHERPLKADNYYRLVLILDNGEEYIVDEQHVIVDNINAKIRINPK